VGSCFARVVHVLSTAKALFIVRQHLTPGDSRTPDTLHRAANAAGNRVSGGTLLPFKWSLRRGGAVSGPWAVSSAENYRLSQAPIVTGRRWEVKYLGKRELYGTWEAIGRGLSRHIKSAS